MSERIEKLKEALNTWWDIGYDAKDGSTNEESENAKAQVLAILSESDKPVDDDPKPCQKCNHICCICDRVKRYKLVPVESDKPVETGEYRVDSINGSAVVLLGDECVLDITGAEPFQGSAIAHKVVGLLGTLSTRVQELEGDLSTMEAHRDEWRLRARDFTADNSKLKERVQELEGDNQMHRLVARDSGHEQTNSYNTIQSLMDENEKLKGRITYLEEEKVMTVQFDGQYLEPKQRHLGIAELGRRYQSLTAEVSTQKAEIEKYKVFEQRIDSTTYAHLRGDYPPNGRNFYRGCNSALLELHQSPRLSESTGGGNEGGKR